MAAKIENRPGSINPLSLDWKDKQLLVTGAGGFIASHLVEALLAKGADATAQDNKGFTALAWAYSPTAMNVTPFKVQREIIRLLKHHEAHKPGVATGREQ